MKYVTLSTKRHRNAVLLADVRLQPIYYSQRHDFVRKSGWIAILSRPTDLLEMLDNMLGRVEQVEDGISHEPVPEV